MPLKLPLLRLNVEIKNALKKENAEANNALVMYNFNAPINIKGLKVSNFFEDSDGKIGHIGGGGVIDPNNQIILSML